MKVLHLCSAYIQSNLYEELIEALDKTGISQVVYIPTKSKQNYNKRILKNLNNTAFTQSKIFNDLDRFLYYRKINKLLADIKIKINLNIIDIIHAHTLFSMGGIALKLKKEKNIDYIVAVRNTDINIFFKYIFYLKDMGIQIMKESKRIILLSPAYRDYILEEIIPGNLQDTIMKKSMVVPNGINPLFLKNKYNRPELGNKKNIKLIYVGEFTKNKNIEISVKVARKLKDMGYNVNFTIVGGGGNNESKVKRLAKTNEDIIEIHELTEEREKLLNIYRKSNIFIMPSFRETFGLVYIEAMSQGLPIIYSKGQGIDGYFKDGTVGYSVNPKDIDDIVKKIEMIINNYSKISKNSYDLVEKFSWENIARIYYNIYMSTQ